MVDSKDTSHDGLQRHPSNTGVPRGSKLPRRGQKNRRRQNTAGQSADTGSVGKSRQNSVKSLDRTDPPSLVSQVPSAPEPDSASERDAERRGDKASKAPRSPDYSSPEPAADTGADKSPVTPDRQSRVPWAPPSPSISEGGKTQPSPPQHTSVGAASLGSGTSDVRSSPATVGGTTPPFKAGTLFRKSSRKSFQKAAKTRMAQPAEPNTQSGQSAPNEESFIQVSEAPTMDLRGNNRDDTDEKSDGRSSAQKQATDDNSNGPTAEVSGDVSYAGALKDGRNRSNGDQGRNESDKSSGAVETQDSPQDRANHSDDSYPDIDPLTLEEHTHQPPPQIRPYEKIRWAPFNVPAERRLQTLAVVFHSVSIIGTVSIFFALCANPLAWPVLIIYLLHILTSKAATDGSLRFRSEWFRSSYLWDLFAGYFPAKLHKTHDLPPTRKYIFGYHPHGIISHGAWAAFVTDALDFSKKFPGITNSLLTLDSNFRIPLYRDYILAMGVRSVSKDSIVNILTRGGANNEGMGRAVTIVVGGARESLEAQPGQLRLILKQRKGFVKVAVRTGADLVPVLAFGENELYEQLQPNKHPLVHQIQMFVLRVWKFTLPFLHGRGIFNYDVGLMPFRHPLNVVVGAPIKVRQSNNPSQEEIDRLHGLYVAELQKIWDRYKDEFAPDRKEEMQIL